MSDWASEAPGTLPTSISSDARRGQVQQFSGDQPVVDHHIGSAQQLGTPAR